MISCHIISYSYHVNIISIHIIFYVCVKHGFTNPIINHTWFYTKFVCFINYTGLDHRVMLGPKTPKSINLTSHNSNNYHINYIFLEFFDSFEIVFDRFLITPTAPFNTAHPETLRRWNPQRLQISGSLGWGAWSDSADGGVPFLGQHWGSRFSIFFPHRHGH